MPDIDLDFPRDIREVLIPRVHEVYGADRSALVAAFPTYRPRGVVRDLGKALGLPPEEIERVAKTVGFHESAGEIERDVVAAIGAERAASPRWRALLWLCDEAMGLPRHASQHSGGMVISTEPLIDVCPVVPAAMEGRQIVQWDKDSCSDAGLPQDRPAGAGDALRGRALRRRSRARRAGSGSTSRGSRSTTSRPTNRSAPPRPPASSRSRAARRCRCCRAPGRENLDDLTVQVALVRPGPIQGGAVHPYIERRKRRRARTPSYEIPYEHPLAASGRWRRRWARSSTRSRCSRWRSTFAGFSPAEAEELRRAMSRKRSQEAIERAPRALPRRRRAEHGVAAGAGRAGLGADPGLLRLRLPEGALGRLRPARLPVGLAARPPRPGVPLRAAERAADGLLPARLAGPRGAAARHPRRPARRQPQPRPLPRRTPRDGECAAGCGADRARLREGGARGGDGGAGRRARARRCLPGDRRAGLALRRRAGEPRTAGLGGRAGRRSRPGRRRRRRASGARRSGGSASPAAGAGGSGGHPAGAADRAAARRPSWSRSGTGGS